MNRRRNRCDLFWLVVVWVGSAVLPVEAQTPISRSLPSGVDVQRDLTYARYGARDLMLDLYTPASGQVAPFVVVVEAGELVTRRGSDRWPQP